MNIQRTMIFFALFCCQLGNSQNSATRMPPFPNGVYLTLEQLRDQTPAFQANFKKSLRSSGDIFLIGGNEIKLESTTDSITEKFIKMKVYAYVKNDTIYMNGMPHKMGLWYGQAITSGNYIVFSGDHGSSGSLGAIGAGIAATIPNYKILSLRTGNVRDFSKDYLLERLKDYGELLAQYKNEDYPANLQTKLKYIHELNKITSPKPISNKK